MAINEEKMKIVIENYFRDECNINTTIHDAFEKGFRIGVNKAIPKQESERKSRDHFERLLHDMFDDMWDDEIEHPRYQDTVGDLMAAVLKAFDKVQPESERKKGRWIIKDNPGTGWYRVTCSECGEDVTSTAPCIGGYPNAKVTWDFCPECGADMREVEE